MGVYAEASGTEASGMEENKEWARIRCATRIRCDTRIRCAVVVVEEGGSRSAAICRPHYINAHTLFNHLTVY
jgi:hypothetical protein